MEKSPKFGENMGIVVKINIRGKTEKMETCFDFGREEELGPA